MKLIKSKVRNLLNGAFSLTLAKLDEQSVRIDEVNARLSRLEEGASYKSSFMSVSEELVIAKIFTGIKMYLDPRDIAVVPHLALDGIWENSMTYAWRIVSKDCTTILDIGANYGYYGLLSAQLGQSEDTKVYLFEANANIIPYLERSLSVNGYHSKCKVENVGIAEKKGTAELTILKDFIGCSSLNTLGQLETYLGGKMPLVQAEKLKVDTISVDEYCANNDIKAVDLVKLDIEGYEEKAYAGMKKIIKNSPKLVVFLEFTKESYENPLKFFNQIKTDFSFIYTIDHQGLLTDVTNKNYNALFEGRVGAEVIVLSKRVLNG